MESDVDLKSRAIDLSILGRTPSGCEPKSAKVWRHFSSPAPAPAEGLEHGGGRGSAAGAVLRKDLVVVRTAAGSPGAHPARAPAPPPRLGRAQSGPVIIMGARRSHAFRVSNALQLTRASHLSASVPISSQHPSPPLAPSPHQFGRSTVLLAPPSTIFTHNNMAL